MANWNQRTVARKVTCRGVGLHSGRPASLTLAPAAPDAGVTFFRRDLGVEIPARAEHVVDTQLSTSLGLGPARVATVEHVLAALTGMGVDNCRVELDGPEIPILDGSAAPFVYLLQEAGVRTQRAGKRFLIVKRPVEAREGDKVARVEPAPELSVRFTVDFGHPLITDQTFSFVFSDRVFAREVARARTFCFLRDVERMQAAGLALGGSLDNAIVVDEFSILNPGGLRYPDEFARHKVLDAMGDLSLLGMPLIATFTARRSGHALNQALVKKLLADPTAHAVVQIGADEELEPLQIRLPALGALDAA
ncbi:UDP-3-O-acyl-N-acetylglucosamine deacetylase [Anaeromyxobacter diazotrophicus]|uniref:UDP-3-O-acyl-N-acetylglucosamine deacetylase n=1 Tax=Anaeromyxobacter diazotrophicus TaxID=2590199 RepID=A0A7I9VJ05_9BACT|nr:UDP-3-O-acyl-N-acetylglucosamine deacetylase [Anaeromyxobacter diazotrophicus]GEJ56110.1 UDP-3-O-acyl-N-acetylglucosamine deacetylase [Anaeromyxobacter diazotrophicus]